MKAMSFRDLILRARAVLAPRQVERDLDEELAFHLERETQKHIANGISPAEARTRARAQFGSVTVAADECRDERGTALLDNLVRDVLYACRSFRRAPLVALTIVTTVGLGLGLVAVVFTLLNGMLFRVDEVRNPHELFAVERQRSANAEPERFHAPAVRSARTRDGHLLRGLRDDGRRHPDRRPTDGGLARDGELLPRPRRQRRAWPHAHTVGRRARRPSGHCPQPSRLVAALRERSRRPRSHAPGEPSPVPGRRRDAGRLSRTRGRCAGLLGAALARRHLQPGPCRTRRLRRHRHHRAAEARSVARPGARGARRVGFATRRCRRAACREPVERPAASLVLATEVGHGLAVGRDHAAVHAALLCVRPHPADRVRERRQPAARARRRTPARNRYPAGDWRVAPTHHLPVAHRKPAAGARVRCAGLRRFTARARRRRLRGDDHHAAGHRRHSPRSAARGLARRAVPGCRRGGIDLVLRALASASGHPPRARPGGAR